jgi:hypothetical protein
MMNINKASLTTKIKEITKVQINIVLAIKIINLNKEGSNLSTPIIEI